MVSTPDSYSELSGSNFGPETSYPNEFSWPTSFPKGTNPYPITGRDYPISFDAI